MLTNQRSQLLDMLLEINNSPQIPSDKRVNIALDPSKSEAPLPVDKDYAELKKSALKRLEELLADVPHATYPSAEDKDLPAPGTADITYPENFLSADDVDDYIYVVDETLPEPDTAVPTLAPAARNGRTNPAALPHLKNPTSVGNWLRKNAPKSFLQDAENDDDGKDAPKRGGRRGERGSKKGKTDDGEGAPVANGRRRGAGKRSSVKPAGGETDASVDDDGESGTPAPRGKRKRDDAVAAARPSKKKRKSDADE